MYNTYIYIYIYIYVLYICISYHIISYYGILHCISYNMLDGLGRLRAMGKGNMCDSLDAAIALAARLAGRKRILRYYV